MDHYQQICPLPGTYRTQPVRTGKSAPGFHADRGRTGGFGTDDRGPGPQPGWRGRQPVLETDTRAVTSAGPTALCTNIIAPPSTGYVDDDGLVFSDSLSRDLAEIREFTTQMQQKFAKSAGAETMDLITFRLAEANVTPVGGSPIEEKIEVIREFTVSRLFNSLQMRRWISGLTNK